MISVLHINYIAFLKNTKCIIVHKNDWLRC